MMLSKINRNWLVSILISLTGLVYGYDKPITIVATPALENSGANIITVGNPNAKQTVQLPAPVLNSSYDVQVTGMVKLIVKTNHPQYVAPNTDTEVKLQIKGYDASGTIIYSAFNYLKVYDLQTASYKDQNYYIFNSQTQRIYKIETEIVQIKVNGSVVPTLPNNILVQSSIDYIRYYYFTPNTQTGPDVKGKDTDGDSFDDILEITWSPLAGAISYELEYTAVNDYDLSSITTNKATSSLNFDFRTNSTHIVTAGNSYTVPLIYDRGYFICRVRAFGKDVQTSTPSLRPYYGMWSYTVDQNTIASFISGTPTNPKPYYQITSHFEKDKNWQYNATFAEEGKHKDVINYADGSLRSRQTITKINSDNTTIVGESLYDYTGRASINVLPVPLPKITLANSQPGQQSFQYKLNFNLAFPANTRYTKNDFDLDDPNNNPCVPSMKPMSTNSGASRYYSANNADKEDFQAFVPDAQKFPFSQVEFTPDNTGRIKKQGGVGPDFQIGSGHETKYFYGTPEQVELDRLFGSEVGYASHYQKNMVIDANGQVSISYINMEGKTIATSLAGNAPPTMVTIPSQAGNTVLKADMFNKDATGKSQSNVVSPDGDAIVFTKSFLVTSANSNNIFDYNITIDKYPDAEGCLKPNVCFHCIYDFEFKITDGCGAVVYSTTNTGKRIIGRFVINGADTVFNTTCYNPNLYSYQEITNSPPLTLSAGAYNITKTLRINKNAKEYYLKQYLDPNYNNCVKPLSYFEGLEAAKPDNSDCAVSCASCFLKIGSKDDYVSKGKGTEEEWDAKNEECRNLCSYPKSSCEVGLSQLLADVSPNGQYGEYNNPNDPLSVFNPANLLPQNVDMSQATSILSTTYPQITPKASPVAYWKKPKYYKNNSANYYTSAGLVAKIKLTKIPGSPNPGNYSYAVDNIGLVTPGTNPGEYFTSPKNLTNLSDFISNWQPSFAKSLVMYHPEYCYYQDCIDKFGVKGSGDTITSNDYDSKLLYTKTFQSAVLKGLLKPNPSYAGGYLLDLSHDPANKPNYYGASFSNSTPMIVKYNSYYTTNSNSLPLHEYVSYSLKCATQFGSNMTTNIPCINFGNSVNAAMQDKEWNMLKAIYFSEKQKMLYQYSNDKRLQAGSSCTYYNACIGNANFDGYSTPMIKYNSSNVALSTSKYFVKDQPCNQVMKDLYAKKTKRFGLTTTDKELPDENEMAYQTFIETGLCPNAVDLQSLMNGLAANGKFAAPSEALQGYQQLTLNFYNYINNVTPAPNPYVSYLWKATTPSGNLNINFTKASNNTVAKYFTLTNPSSGIVWANVQSVTQFQVTGTSGPNWTFSCVVKELVGTTLVSKTVNGLTDIKLDGCMFKDVCKPNDLAKELLSLMSSLKGNNLMQTTQLLGAPGSGIYGSYLLKTQQLVGQTAVTPPALTWKYVAGTSWSYEISDNTTPTCKLRINLLTLGGAPITAQLLSNITAFKKIKSDYQNQFTMEAYNATYGLIGIVKGEVFKICNGQTTPIAMGNCDKPEPLSCRTEFHQNRKELEALLKDIITAQKYTPVIASNASNVLNNFNLSSSMIANFTPLASSIPVNKFSVINNFYKSIGFDTPSTTGLPNDSMGFVLKSPCITPSGGGGGTGDPTGKTVGGSSGSETNGTGGGGPPVDVPCPETIYCKVWVKTNNKTATSGATFANIIKFKKLVGYGNTNNNNYNDFYVLVDYMINSTVVSDTLFGSSCYGLQNCSPCATGDCCGQSPASYSARFSNPSEKNDVYEQEALRRGLAKVDNTVRQYSTYVEKLSGLNSKMGWTPDNGNYIAPVTYIEMSKKSFFTVLEKYTHFVEAFNPAIDDVSYLNSISSYVSDFGFYANPVKSYKRYTNALTYYNSTAREEDKLTAIEELSYYKQKYSDITSSYLDYLSDSKSSGNLPKSLQEFAAAPGGGDPPPMVDCSDIYDEYVIAYNNFILNYKGPRDNIPPFYTYQQFIDFNYCCPQNGSPQFHDYVNVFGSPFTFPGQISYLEPCDDTNPTETECADLYISYLQQITAYNNSTYAIEHNSYININLFVSSSSFYQQGYCKCLNKYLTYLSKYINEPSGSVLNTPVTIKNFQGCNSSQSTNYCEDIYNDYINTMTNFGDWLAHHPLPTVTLPVMYDISQFTYDNLCYCAPAFLSFLNAVMSGAITDEVYIAAHMDIHQFCNQQAVVPCPPSTGNSFEGAESPLLGPSQDPCDKFKQDKIKANAASAYAAYLLKLSEEFLNNYTEHCMTAVETMERQYDDREFHYTLYYYDQAGNLIRTIPPEGIDAVHYASIKYHTDPNAVKAKNDRAYKTKTLFTKHRLATTYAYNSLNQLSKQKTPDHDGLTSLSYVFNYGLDTAMKISTSQFPDPAKGFVAGNESLTDPYFSTTLTRGKLFESNDGSLSWKPVNNIIGTDLKKVQFVSTTSGGNYGFAVGSNGAFMVSIDGGINWDYFPIHKYTNGSNLNDLVFAVDASQNIKGMIVGDNGTALAVNIAFNGSGPVINALPTVVNFPALGSNDNVTDVAFNSNFTTPLFFITVLNKTNNTSKIFSGDGSTNTSGFWFDITATQLSNLTKVRQLKATANYYAGGEDGHLIKSTNGTNWNLIETNTALKFLDLYFANANDAVAILEDASGFGSLYKSNDGGANWMLLDQGSSTKNYRNLSPYVNYANLNQIDKLVATGPNGLIKRVTINYTTPGSVFSGFISTDINPSNSPSQINDVCVVPYNVVGSAYQQFALAAGDNGQLYYCLDFNQNVPVWNPINVAFPAVNFKKVLFNIQNPNSAAPSIDGLLIDNNGVLYNFTCSNFLTMQAVTPVAPVFVTAVKTNVAANDIFNDMVYDWNSSTNIYGSAYLIGRNTVSNAFKFSNLPLQSVTTQAPNVFANTGSSTQNFNSLLVNSTSTGNHVVLAVNTTGNIIKGATANINSNANNLTLTDLSLNIQPGKINEIVCSSSKVAVVGNDGYFAEKQITAGSFFSVKRSTTSSDFTSLKYLTVFGGDIYLFSTQQGEVGIINSVPANNLLTYLPNQISSSSINDINFKTILGSTEIYAAGDNGGIFYSTGSLGSPYTQVPVSSSENFNTVAFFPSATNNNALVIGNTSVAFELNGLSAMSNKNWYTNEITKLHFTDPNNGYFVGKQGLIRHTQDGGLSWKSIAPYLNSGNSNLPPDLYGVYTVDVDAAIIAGSHNYLANCANLTPGAPLLALTTNVAQEQWNDIDLSNNTEEFVVGTKYSNSTYKAAKLSLTNNQVSATQLVTAASSGSSGFRAVYTFKNSSPLKFIAVGESRSFKIYNHSTQAFENLTFTGPTPLTTLFGASDRINDVVFTDNSNGYLVGVNTKFVNISVDHSTYNVKLTDELTSATTPFVSTSEINTIGLIGGPDGFLGGYLGNGSPPFSKYAWKYTHQTGGETSSQFWYDRLGRMVLSQNSKQANKVPKAYSYTLYDALGRIMEVGEKAENTTSTNVFKGIFGVYINNYLNMKAINDNKLTAWINDATGARTEVTHTYYDNVAFGIANGCSLPNSFPQNNLRKRVASVTYEDSYDGLPCTYENATHYSYDIHGNVSSLLQDNQKLATPSNNPLAGQRYKRTDYDYDLISGKVNQVSYQKGEIDCFYHRYEYDDDNRITRVSTSRDGSVWENDAKYFYYRHGPLARTELGQDKVQGIDYAYTLQGWIKGTNSNALDPNKDMGKDGGPTTINAVNNKNHWFGRDAGGFTLGYYMGDYAPIDATAWTSTNRFEMQTPMASDLMTNRSNLYNGNIAHMVTSLSMPYMAGPNSAQQAMPQASAYKYDQLNRISQALSFDNFDAALNTWKTGGSISNKYRNDFVYDANGNISSQQKYDMSGLQFDNLTYRYDKDASNFLKSNKLYHVNDGISASAQVGDIEDEGVFSTAANGNYAYDEIGNLKKDLSEDIVSIKWNLMGKIKEINRSPGSPKKDLKFDYDAQGNRIAKHLYNGSTWVSSTYYSRDAQGNVMSTYINDFNVTCANCLSYRAIEYPLYGSSRFGMDKHERELIGTVNNFSFYNFDRYVGKKQFEISNHLGNINAVVTDKKYRYPDGTNTNVDYFLVDVIATNDYYPFGDPMSGRDFVTADYRYGFNGKEKDDEVKGNGNSLDFGARIYDPRLGKWFSLDPLQTKYPYLSPYNFVANSPMIFIDPDGKKIVITHRDQKGKVISMTIYKGGKLFNTDGSEYKGKDAYVLKVASYLDKLKDTDERVKQVVGDLDVSSKRHEITNVDPNPPTKAPANGAYNRRDLEEGKETGGSVTKIDFDKDNKTADASDEEKLAHELKHGWNKDNGINHAQDKPSGNGKTSLEEVDAVNFGNIVREKEGKAARDEYGGDCIDPKDLKTPSTYELKPKKK